MSGAWSVNIRILDRFANPVDLVAVSITSSPVPVPDIAALTGPDGQVSFRVPCAGKYGVLLNAEGHPIDEKQIDAVEDATVTDVSVGE